ncbi:MAG TPA: DUF6514 family protein [Clostridia bacterium]|nr:MAG: hypothetical protein BWX97_02088 [Firmicutes bacterium ADurb.Bin146]HOD92591.1 DUF6514 family protein [Clostridia bacterium]HQM39953.1 DUF6514 family protein [Clostridia bacterium]
MSTYTLKRSSKLIDERKHTLDIKYFLIEEFTIRQPSGTYGIKVDTIDNGQITDTCTVNDITQKKEEALYILEKMADYEVTAISAKDVIEDMVF